MKLLRWGFSIVAIVVLVVAAIYGIGASLPLHHSAHAERLASMPTTAVAARLRAVRDYPSWRPGLDLVVTSENQGAITYIETLDGDRIAYRLTEPEHGRRFVSAITDETLPFGGHWTITLTPQGDSTLVRIEEDGDIRDPIYRFFARFVFGYTSSMESYLDQLQASAAITPAPNPPPGR